jgi:hypothetical protein
MKRVLIWLIERTDIQIFSVITVIVLDEIIFPKIKWIDSFIKYGSTSILSFIMIVWIYYSLFFIVNIDEDKKQRITFTKLFYNVKESSWKVSFLSLLLIFTASSYSVFGKYGAILSLIAITLSTIIFIFLIVKKVASKDFSEPGYRNTKDEILFTKVISIVVLSAIVGYFHFLIWSGVYSGEFGVKEIGHYFEKSSYDTNYYVWIRDAEENKRQKLLAEISVSGEYNDYTEFESGEDIHGSMSNFKEFRGVKINKVFLNNGEIILFGDDEPCIVLINQNIFCYDQNGKEWEIDLINEKIDQ